VDGCGARSGPLLLVAIAVNNLTGRRYPHRAPAAAPPAGAAAELGPGAADIESAMARLSQRLDVLPQDVVALVQDAEAHALDRRLGSVAVERIMHTDMAAVRPAVRVHLPRAHGDRATAGDDASRHRRGRPRGRHTRR